MNPNHPNKVTAFDAFFTTKHIQMLKLLLRYLDPSLQGHLAVYIKLLELKYTLNFFQNYSVSSMKFNPELGYPDGGINELLDELQPLCSPEELEKIQNLKKMYENLENMQEMMQILEMMQEISPEFFSGGSNAATDFSNLFSGINGSELSQMMDMLQNMFPGNH
jgi:hypothetical protein